VKTSASHPSVIRFGVFELDLQSKELRKLGMKIRLQGQPVDVLAMLLERAGEVVTREELQRKLWPADTFVDFEQGLNNAMKRLRAALDDKAEAPRFIETLPRHGYRFIGAVNRASGAADALLTDTEGRNVAIPVTRKIGIKTRYGTEIRTPADKKFRRFPATTAILLIALGAVVAWLNRPAPLPRLLKTIQITRDGVTKVGFVTDGSRLYIAESELPRR